MRGVAAERRREAPRRRCVRAGRRGNLARALVAGVAALAGRAAPARAWFESSPVGAHALSLANSFVSVADDASALYWNPAGLVQLTRHELFLSYERTAQLEGLQSGFAGLVLHVPRVSLGLGWQHTGLEGALAEDLVYLSLARTAVRRSLGAFVSAGGTLKIAHVGLETEGFETVPGLQSGATALTGDLGLLLVPIPNVTAGAIVRNLGRPQFDLLRGGERTTLANEFEWGVSLRWREDAWLHASRVRHSRGDATTRVGVELQVGNAIRVRAGAGRDVVASGVGVGWGPWKLDSAFQAHDVLGVTYRVALRRAFGRERQAMGGGFDPF